MAKKTAKASGTKTAVKKPAAKKPVAKPVAKSLPKPAPKPVKAVKPAAKGPIKPVKGGKPEKGPAKVAPAAHKPEHKPGDGDDKKNPARKGITIVNNKPAPKRPKPAKPSTDISAIAGNLVASGVVRRPLIASGPNAPALRPLGSHGGGGDAAPKVAGKSPFGKKDLERFRLLLVRKRAELLGDISHLEEGALRGESGSLSNLPQHMAEQGSEAYDQSLQLDLAAADRKMLKEIDDAIARIDAGTFGVCEMTGKPIKAERLEELPWARYSIEAAREIERRSMRA